MAASDSVSSSSTRRRGHDSEPIAEAIAAATRGIHTKLNKSIIARLPLILPPRASDPSTYVTGLLHIAPIYTTFERLWQELLEPSTHEGADPHAEQVTSPPPADKRLRAETLTVPASFPQTSGQRIPIRVHSILHALHLPGLARSPRLKSDIQTLTGWPEHVVESQLKVASQSPHLAAMIHHMESSVLEKPLLLVTYTYIMYMALFAGGRFIRATLESTGAEFWQTTLSPIKPTMQPCVPTPSTPDDEDVDPKYHSEIHKCQHPLPLSFFHFDTPHDGEDLKAEFKRRLRICEAALEPHETKEIVQEATTIFEHITSIVHQLDAMCEDDSSDAESVATPSDYLHVMPLLGRLRDSMAVAKERHARNSPTSSSENNSADTVIRRRTYRSSASTDSHTSGSTNSDHPPIPVVTGVELCPVAAVKAVRLNSATVLPQPIERKNWTGIREQMKASDMTSCVLAALLGIVAMGVLLASRRGATTT